MSKAPISPLSVIARSPTKLYFEGEAESIAAINRVGAFSILAGHADFFSLLQPCTLTITTKEESIDIVISSGIITVQSGSALLFLNI